MEPRSKHSGGIEGAPPSSPRASLPLALPTLRAAAPADAPACAAVLVTALADLRRRLGRPAPEDDPGPDARDIAFALARPGASGHVAEEAGRVVAFALAWPRDGLWWLGYNFALPEHQGKGTGAALLARAMSGAAAAPNAFTFASGDATAQALYLRQRLLPWATCLTFDVPTAASEPGAYRLAPLARGSMTFERERFGFARGHEHRHFHEAGGLGREVQRPDGARAGFFYLLDGHVGPLAVEGAEDVAPALEAGLEAAREAGWERAMLRVPNSNAEALRWCARRRARLLGLNLLMSRAPVAAWDRVVLGKPGMI